MVPTPEQFLAQRRGEANFSNGFVTHARKRQLRNGRLTAKQSQTLILLLPEQLAEVDRFLGELEVREQQVARDVAEHGQLAVDWYTWQDQGDLVVQTGLLRQRTSSRPRGGSPAAKRSSRSTRAGPSDDDGEPSEPSERPCDRLLKALRNSNEDAYRVVPSADGWAWMARCPCAPDAGHSMLIIDRGDESEPGIACRFACDLPGIKRMLGLDDPERVRFVAEVADTLTRYRTWLRERRAS